MTTNARATAAPIPVTIDSKQYLFTPFSRRDFGMFENWVQGRYIEVYTANLKKAPEDHRRGLLEQAYAHAATLTIASPEATKLMISMDGAIQLAWISLRHEHPDITIDEVSDLMFDDEKRDRIMEVLDRFDRSTDRSSSVDQKKKRNENRHQKRKQEKRKREKRIRKQKR